MKQSIIGVVVVALLWIALQGEAQECAVEGDVRIVPIPLWINSSIIRSYPQYCFREQWSMLCTENSVWDQTIAAVLCRQLGYSDQDPMFGADPPSTQTDDFIRLPDRYTGTGATLQDCPDVVRRRSFCDSDEIGWLECLQACTTGEIRLVMAGIGANYTEGRVEVCVDGRWGTVCNNNLTLTGAACAQAGFPAEDAVSTALETVPIYQCNVSTNGTVSCTMAVTGTCERSLGAVCQTHQAVVEKILRTCTEECKSSLEERENTCQEECDSRINDRDSVCNQSISRNEAQCNRAIMETMQGCIASNNQPSQDNCPVTVTIPALGAVIGLLVVVLMIAVVGWIVTCVKHSSKQRSERDTPVPAANPADDEGSADDQGLAANPAYELCKRDDNEENAYEL